MPTSFSPVSDTVQAAARVCASAWWYWSST